MTSLLSSITRALRPREVDYKALAETWKAMSHSWEQIAKEADLRAQASAEKLLAASATDNPKLTEYAGLIRELVCAANGIYVTPKVSSVPDDAVLRIMAAVQALNGKLHDDGFATVREY